MKEFRFWVTINNQKKEFTFMANSWTEARAMMSVEYKKALAAAG